MLGSLQLCWHACEMLEIHCHSHVPLVHPRVQPHVQPSYTPLPVTQNDEILQVVKSANSYTRFWPSLLLPHPRAKPPGATD